MISLSEARDCDLPPGYEWVLAGRWRAAVRSDARSAVEAAGIDAPEAWAERGTGRYRGRGRPVGILLADDTPAVLRRYLHGGLLGRLLGGRFLGRVPRPLVELRATERARAGGVNVPEVLAALFRRGPLFHEGYLLTREVEGARDLLEVLRGEEPAGVLLAGVGGQARRMHDAGVLHADLHVKNVLVRSAEVFLIDFDRARIMAELPASLRERSLLRFDRSLVKAGLTGDRVSRADRLRVLVAHEGGRVGRERLDGLVRRCRRSVARHQLWWRIGGRS
jgi:hypothetical protein